tara:strand:+ start:761 stop:1573 length:813 start_codon:yes stop_codon:yes gene_type:complete
MANPNSKSTLKEYCLRTLGKGAVDINVTDNQADDRLDEALQYFSHYYYDGIEKMYLKYKITSADITRGVANATTTATDVADTSITASFEEGKNFIPMPDSVVSVLRIFSFDNSSTNNMFDMRYQMRLNDLYDFSSTSIVHYEMTMQHLDYLSHLLVGETPIRFQEHQRRLYLDMDWSNDISEDDYLIIECYRKIDPDTFTDLYNDIHLKRYATALIKRQWGQNLSKFNEVQLLGGVTMNGEQIYTQAQDDITKLEEQIQNMQYPDMLIKG